MAVREVMRFAGGGKKRGRTTLQHEVTIECAANVLHKEAAGFTKTEAVMIYPLKTHLAATSG